MGFCDAARPSFDPSSTATDTDDPDKASFVTEPALGPRPDLIDENANKNEEFPNEYEDYDEARCEVIKMF